MLNYIFKRLLLGAISLIALTVIVFFLIYIRKEDPIDITEYKDETEYLADFKKYNLDKPVLERFWIYLSGIFEGDFGAIYKGSDAKTIPELFFRPLKDTITITSISFVLSTILGISLGYIAGYNSGKWIDNIISFIVILFMAIPSFVLASLFLIVGPRIGLQTSFLDHSIFGLGRYLNSLVAPILVLTLGSMAVFTYYTRNEIKSILSSDYILNAKSKGLSGLVIFRKYVVRNSAIPLIGVIINSFVIILGSSLVIEIFFNVPGTSSVILKALYDNEINIIMFNTLFFGFISVIARIIIDILYVVLDPRIRYSTASKNNLKLVNRFKKFGFNQKWKKELKL